MPCEHCLGTGRRLEHAPTCDDDWCALNGGMRSCAGDLVPCWCVRGRRVALAPALRRCYWLAHPESQRRRDDTPFAIRRPLARCRRPWAYARLLCDLRHGYRRQRKGAGHAPRG